MSNPQRSLTELVSAAGHVEVEGVFYRHAAPNRDAFAGGEMGRWGANFPVIYLGRPIESIIVEAYRHLVEDAGVEPKSVRPRVEFTVPVKVSRILDLRDAATRNHLGLSSDDLGSPVGEYAACQSVAAAAHQLRYHGILATSASGLGETLALFRRNLPAAEIPVPSEQRLWATLPADPRRLRRVQAGEA